MREDETSLQTAKGNLVSYIYAITRVRAVWVTYSIIAGGLILIPILGGRFRGEAIGEVVSWFLQSVVPVLLVIIGLRYEGIRNHKENLSAKRFIYSIAFWTTHFYFFLLFSTLFGEVISDIVYPSNPNQITIFDIIRASNLYLIPIQAFVLIVVGWLFIGRAGAENFETSENLVSDSMPLKPRVFISYAHDDLETVRKLYNDLKAREVNVWLDKEDIDPGKWKKKIRKAIAQSRFFLFCISDSALRKTDDGSGFVDEELQLAFDIAMAQDERQFTIVPVRLEECGHGDHRLSVFQQFDLFKDWEKTIGRLAKILNSSFIDQKERDASTSQQIDGTQGKILALHYAGGDDAALAILRALLLENPKNVEAWNQEGIILSEMGRYSEALEAFDRALEFDSANANIWNHKGIAFNGAGAYEDALLAFNKAISINPENSTAWYSKCDVLLKLNRKEEARQAVEKAKSIDPRPTMHSGFQGI